MEVEQEAKPIDAVEEQVQRLLFRLEAEEAVIRIARNHPGYGEVSIQEKRK